MSSNTPLNPNQSKSTSWSRKPIEVRSWAKKLCQHVGDNEALNKTSIRCSY